MSVCELPTGWFNVELGEILELKYGKSLPAKNRDGKGSPVYGSNGIIGMHSEPIVNTKGLIIGRKGSFGEVHISQESYSPIDTTYFVDEFFGMPIKYWYYQLKRLPLTQLNRSTAIPGLNRDDAYEQQINLPSLEEQKQIATKLNELLAQVDTIKTRLDAIHAILKRFRQSVLATAVSGKLTAEWRINNPDKLLDHEEVRQVIENEYSLKKKPERNRVDKAHANDWFYSCKDFIPVSWLEAYLIDVTNLITCGVAKKPNYLEKGIPFLSAQNSKPFSPNLNKIKYISQKDFKKFTVGGKPEKGDVLYSRVGAKFGEACQVPWDFDFAIYVSLTLLKPAKTLLNGTYLTLFLNSPDGVLQAHGGIMGSGLQNLNVESVRKYKIPLPSLDEQNEVVRCVGQLFNFADIIEQQVNSAQSRVNNLTQSILAKAFRGEITAEWREQNPDLISGKNSAEFLLEKIRKEREFLKPAKKAKKIMRA